MSAHRAALAAAALALVVATPISAKEYPQLTVGTLSAGSVTFATMNAMAGVLKDKLPWPIRVQPTTGGSVAITLAERGENPLCISTSQEVAFARVGHGSFLKSPNIRVLGVMYPLTGSVIVRGDSDITSVAQLKGKRVTGEYKAHGVGHELMGSALANHGLTWKDVTMVPTANILTGLDALKEGRADGIYGAIGPAQFREADATLPGGIRYLSFNADPSAQEAMQKDAPGTYVVPAKAGSFPGIKEDIGVQAFDYYLCASKDFSNEQAYQLTKAIIENVDAIKGSIPPWRGLNKDKMVKTDVTAPYHEGAVKAYKEAGMWTPEAEAAQAKLLGK